MDAQKRFFLSKIFKTYNQLKAHARRAGDLKQIERINRALGIALSSNYYQDERANYQTSLTSCSCKDWQYRHAARRQYTGACKHMISYEILRNALTSTQGLLDTSLNCSILNTVEIQSSELDIAGVYRPAVAHL